MSMKHQTVLASRPAAMVLALSLVGGLTTPFVLLPQAQAAGGTPAPCTVGNTNGCTELSPTPPEDTVAVPANIVLMLDDSGSMRWDVMPDYSSLVDTTTEGLINSGNNGAYYNPDVVYSLPSKVDGTPYPASTFSAALVNGFDSGSNTVDISTYRGRYDSSDTNYSATAVQYSISVAKSGASSYNAATSCPSGTSASGKYSGYCYWTSVPPTSSWYNFSDLSNGDFYVSRCNSVSDVYNNNYTSNSKPGTCTPGISFFTYTTGASGAFVRHYVAKNSGDCAAAGLASTVCDQSAAALQNVANWFSYYHTRILMAKSGLTSAFDRLNPNYRFGFGSINGGNNGALTAPTGTFGSNNNKIAEVQPFGDGSSGTQRANFWNWITTLTPPKKSTPLRRSLQAVGKYYQTQQPWTTMSSDPGWTNGSTTKFACRASYTILTTDGFWNGDDPSGIGNADNTAGPIYSPPAGKTYTVKGYTVSDPYKDGYSNTLADVAMYYWAHDLQDGSGGSFNLPDEVAPSTADPAFWQHMTTFTMGMGFDPVNITGTAPNGDSPPTIQDIFNWAKDGGSASSAYAITGFGWPAPSAASGGSINNIADLAHAAVNGHGDFFSAKNPQEMAAGFAKAIAEINARTTTSPAASVNASVVAVGAIGFQTSYNTGDWSGTFQAVILQEPDAKPGDPMWTPSPNALLDSAYHLASGTINRPVYTVSYNPGNATPFTSFQFTPTASSFDASEMAGLQSPALAGGNDTLPNRINYLLGSSKYEAAPYRTRTTLLGAVIHAQPVYVGYPTGNYFSFPAGTAEATAAAASTGSDDQAYDSFVARHATRAPTVYLGANDGMLHAFNAPVPQCATYSPTTQTCSAYTPNANAGLEDWAFIPRAVYANLGNLTNANFQFRPTVDSTPVTRDVFFGGVWHTMLAGGVGLGGRGVYALDITGPANSSTPTTKPNVLWEFDADMTDANGPISGCVSNAGACAASDLGFTVSQPNIGRLANGKWVVIVPNGYFPDCTTPDIPTDPSAPAGAANNCQTVANQAPGWANGASYSALFVLDAQTGKVLAELKTPQITGVTSFGLATPVLGDYQNDQIDDVAFAGDAMGNLWRFDLSGSTPSSWTVTLAYKGGTAKDPSGNTVMQPITSMPRLFPDPTTNRFMVVFGTGRFLGVGDNSNTDVQALYGVRDQGNAGTSAGAYTQADLVQQYLHETTIPAGATLPDGSPNPNAGATLRCVTGSSTDSCASSASGGSPSLINPVPSGKGGWYISLQTTTSGGVVNDAGERVVVNPGAIFASNTVVFETLITGSQSSDPCSPTTVGSIMALNALTGGASGVSSLGGGNIVGGRINNARTSGSLPLVSALGGGQTYLPGTTLAPNGTSPLSIDSPIWRRRSWNEIKQN